MDCIFCKMVKGEKTCLKVYEDDNTLVFMDTLKDADGAMGNRTKAKVVKNKLAPPFRQAEFDIVFGEGISQEGCIIDMGVQFDIIGKSGAFYSYNGAKIAQGREKLRLFLKDNPEVMAEIEGKIRAAAAGKADEETEEE